MRFAGTMRFVNVLKRSPLFDVNTCHYFAIKQTSRLQEGRDQPPFDCPTAHYVKDQFFCINGYYEKFYDYPSINNVMYSNL
jgi:hypothetical protein